MNVVFDISILAHESKLSTLSHLIVTSGMSMFPTLLIIIIVFLVVPCTPNKENLLLPDSVVMPSDAFPRVTTIGGITIVPPPPPPPPGGVPPPPPDSTVAVLVEL